MFCRHAAVRQRARAWLSKHSAPEASPLWIPCTRPFPLGTPTILHTRQASIAAGLEPIIKEIKPHKKRAVKIADKTVTTTEDISIVERKRAVSKTPAKPRKKGTKEKAGTTPIIDVPLTANKKRGRPRAVLPVATTPVSRRKASKSSKGAQICPPRIAGLAKEDKYYDLESFERWVEQHHVRKDTSMYKGTHFEYTVLNSLSPFGLQLKRVGRKQDLGIDLIGQWILPSDRQELKVIIQCKASKNAPCMVRELEGTLRNAPPGYRGDGVLGILVSITESTRGVREAIQRSRLPMGFANITSDGVIQQFIWNDAAKLRLDGLTVVTTYGTATTKTGEGTNDGGHLSLLWLGKPWAALSAEM